MKNAPLILVDGSSYLFRAYHALPPLTNSKGKPTGAIYGVINMLRRLLNEYQPTDVGIIFDPKGGSFRHQLYPDYKANRKKMPEELSEQIEPLFEIIRAMGLPLLIIENVEADDVIGTLSQRATQQKREVIISTGDKDMAQLVNTHVTLINTMNDTKLDIVGVKEKFGVMPEQMIDYLTLMGDTSDNVPGVMGVGPKTAAKWLNEYGSLENMIQHADKISGKVGENFRAFIPQIPLTRILLTIKHDVDLMQQPEDLKLLPQNIEKLKYFFEEYEFKSWLKELQQFSVETENTLQNKRFSGNEFKQPAQGENVVILPMEITPSRKDIPYTVILHEDMLDQLIHHIQTEQFFSFDTETTSLAYMDAHLVGMSFSFTGGKNYYLPVGHTYLGAPEQLDKKRVLEKLKPFFENKHIEKIGQNIKYDKEILANESIDLQGIKFDTMIESYVLNSIGSRHNLDSLALKYLNHQNISYEDVTGKGAKKITFDQVDIEKAAPYATEDSHIVLKLHDYFFPKLIEHSNLLNVFEKIEMPLIDVLVNMERNGVLIDIALLAKQSEELAKKIKEKEDLSYQLAGCLFNLSSPKQLQEILFEKLKLPQLRKTPGGQPSTAEDVLQDLALDYPLPKIILEYRSLSKLKSTYTDSLPLQISPNTGRIHTSFHQAITSTGRLSSSDPNLQNIPIKTEEGRRIRQAFIAPPHYKIIAADYSQIELRIMAHLSHDPGLLQAFNQQQDVHSSTAAQVFGVNLDAVTQEQRRKAKAINFGLIYGMSAFGLAKQIGVDRQTAQYYMDEYFKKYPGVKTYMEETRRLAHHQGFVETISGRRLYLPDINSRTIMLQKAAERTAINAPMQGTAADIIKMAMIRIDRWLASLPIKVKMILQVHDELVFEAPEEHTEILISDIKYHMENVVKLDVPLIADIGIGHNWDEAHS